MFLLLFIGERTYCYVIKVNNIVTTISKLFGFISYELSFLRYTILYKVNLKLTLKQIIFQNYTKIYKQGRELILWILIQ